MEHYDKVNAIKFIRPNSEFKLSGDELDWLDQHQTEPTKKEIEIGLIEYKKAIKAEAEAKAAQRQAVLDRLKLTSEEAALLLS